MFRLTLSIPQTTWDALAAEETTPYRAARRVLNEWAQAQITGASPSTVEPARSLHTHTGEVMRPPTLTNDQLARARKWIADTERTLPPDMTTRRQLRAWLESEGFRP